MTKLGHYQLVLGIPWLRYHGVVGDFSLGSISINASQRKDGHVRREVEVHGEGTCHPTNKQDISLVGAAAFARLARNHRERHGKLRVFSLSLYEINRALEHKKLDEEGIKGLVPREYHDLLPLFTEAAASELLPHRWYDHKIPLKNDFEPPFGPLYSLSRQELEALKAWPEENLSKGFIRQSESSAGACSALSDAAAAA